MRILSKLRTSVALVVFVVVCSVILLAINLYELHWMQIEHLRYHHKEETEKHEIPAARNSKGSPVYLAFGRDVSFVKFTNKCIDNVLLFRSSELKLYWTSQKIKNVRDGRVKFLSCFRTVNFLTVLDLVAEM